MPGLDNFLKLSLMIAEWKRPGLGLKHRREEMAHDREHGIESAVEINCSDHRLESARENRGLLLAPSLRLALTQAYAIAKADVARELCQGFFVHDGGPHL